MSVGFPRANVFTPNGFVSQRYRQIIAVGNAVTGGVQSTVLDIFSIPQTSNVPNPPAWGVSTNLTNGQADIGSTVAVGYLPDGRVQLFWIGTSGTIWSLWNNSLGRFVMVGTPLWSPPQVLVANPLFAGGQLSVGYRSDNRMQLFILTPQGAVWTMAKTSADPNAGWTVPSPISSIPDPNQQPSMGTLCVGYQPDNTMVLFVAGFSAGANSDVFWMAQASPDPTLPPDSGWSPLTSLNLPIPIFEGPYESLSLGYYDASGRMQLFCLSVYSIFTSRQQSLSSVADWDTTWTLLEAGEAIRFYHTNIMGPVFAVGYHAVGGPPPGLVMEIFFNVYDNLTGVGGVYSRWQLAPDPSGTQIPPANWSLKAPVGNTLGIYPSDSAFGFQPDGTMLLSQIVDASISSIWQTSTDPDNWPGQWSAAVPNTVWVTGVQGSSYTMAYRWLPRYWLILVLIWFWNMIKSLIKSLIKFLRGLISRGS
jgi:hypothetical protein